MKALYAGAGLALSAGLLLGAGMKPDLTGDDRPAGPQMFAASEVGLTGPFDDGMTLANYGANVPTYVLGSDWAKAANPYMITAAAPAADVEDADRASLAESAEFTRLAYAEDTPSQAEESPPPREPEIDQDAPPEATGDTTPAEG